MKTNKLIARGLVLLGFGGAVGFVSSCGGGRVQKSRTPDANVARPDGDAPVQVMYGVRPTPYRPGMPVRERVVTGKVAGTVTGRVTDAEDGQPLYGALVEVLPADKGNIAVVTDEEGRYSIAAAKGDSLGFSYIGYASQKLKVGSDTLDVRMKIDIMSFITPVISMYGVRPAHYDLYRAVPPDKPLFRKNPDTDK